MRRPLGLRPVRQGVRREGTNPLPIEELGRRARWGGLLPEVPELKPQERARWDAHRRGTDAWVPRAALDYAWHHVDGVHGDGDWNATRFREAVDRDRREIAQVVAEHPEKADRLRRWLVDIEVLAAERDGDPDRNVGHYYKHLSALGYSGQRERDE